MAIVPETAPAAHQASGRWLFYWQTDASQAVVAALLAFLSSALLLALLLASWGKPTGYGLYVLLLAPLSSWHSLAEVALKLSPILLCALGLAWCYRAKIWNIGAEGQFICGGIAAATILLASWAPSASLPRLLLAAAAGAAAGALWAALFGYLRQRFDASEILVTLMLNYIAQLFLLYVVNGPLKDPAGMNFPQSALFSHQFPMLSATARLPLAFVVALALAVFMYLLQRLSLLGFRIKTLGASQAAARYAGFSQHHSFWFCVLVAGACAGLAGAFEVGGPIGQLLPSISPGYGYTAIIVVLLGRQHALAMIVAAALLASLQIGGEMAQSRLGLPGAMSQLMQGLLLLNLLAWQAVLARKGFNRA